MLVVSTILRVGSAFVVNSGSWSADVQLCSSPLGTVEALSLLWQHTSLGMIERLRR